MRMEVDPVAADPREQAPWYLKLATLLALIFCFELGVFLLIFPWATDWRLNFFSNLPMWNSPYFRGAVSGLGMLNIYISLSEVMRLRRRAREE